MHIDTIGLGSWYTLNPEPSTINLYPLTLNPQPSTQDSELRMSMC